jgi:hypothetical protein
MKYIPVIIALMAVMIMLSPVLASDQPVNLAGEEDRYFLDENVALPFLIDGSRRMEDPHIQRNNDTSYLELAGGTNPTTGGAAIILTGADYPGLPGYIIFFTTNAAHTKSVIVMHVSGSTDDPVIDFNGHRVGNVQDPILDQDLMTKGYMERYFAAHCNCSS